MTQLHCNLDEALAEFRAGRPVVLLDEVDRENEGDLILPAELLTPEWLNFMLREACGLLTVPMEPRRLAELGIDLIPPRNIDHTCPRFTVPVDAACLESTGISVTDRLKTIQRLMAPDATPDDFIIPGHVFPLAADPTGLAGRRGHTEGALALAKAAGLYPAVAMCEILREDGEMAKDADLDAFAARAGLKIITMDCLVAELAA